MMLVLTCALCAAEPALPVAGDVDPDGPGLLDERLSLRHAAVVPPYVPVSLALGRTADDGSGGGEDHSDHMGPMWIVMGVMMAVMMVGMGVYLMRHATPAQTLHPAASPSPAQLALPVTAAHGGAG